MVSRPSGYQALRNVGDDELLGDSDQITDASLRDPQVLNGLSSIRDPENSDDVVAIMGAVDTESGTSDNIESTMKMQFSSIMAMFWSSTALISGKYLSLIEIVWVQLIHFRWL